MSQTKPKRHDRFIYAIVREQAIIPAFWFLVLQDAATARRSADGRVVIKRRASDPLPPQASLVSILEHDEIIGELRADEAWNLPPDFKLARTRDAIAVVDSVSIAIE